MSDELAVGTKTLDMGMLSRAQGCLLGQLAGDSLGGLVEFKDTGQIRSEYPNGVRDFADGGTWGTLAGQPTDDSELALALARTLVRSGNYDPGAVLDAYVAWIQDPQTFDVGGTIGRALRAAAGGKSASERLQLVAQHADPSRPTNGSLMRISPLGIFCANHLDHCGEWARAESRLTHPNDLCQDACAVFVTAIAAAIARGGGREIAYTAALVECTNPQVRQALVSARVSPPADYVTHMGWVLIALQNAFYQLLNAPNMEEGIVDTIMRGGDTDTNAAIAGALLGAVYGRERVPHRWLETLLSCRPTSDSGTKHPRKEEYWTVDALELAEKLLQPKR